MIRQLNQKVAYIGSDDLDIDLFESQYIVPEGVSYNSYLILDQKTAILDTSDARKGSEWKESLAGALGGRKPDYLVVHHLEPDHSALIAWVLKEYPEVTLVAGAQALRMLPHFFPGIELAGRTLAVKEGDVLELGEHSLRFIAAPMVHWPEVMMSFDAADGALYSADGFGKFGALEKCGFYGRDDDDWACEARRYYFNIVGKYGPQVQQVPLYGPILEDNLGEYSMLYDTWSRYEPETDGILIAVASIHGGTMEAAQHLAHLLADKHAPKVVLTDLSRSDIAENVEDAFRYPKVIFAAASYDAGLFTPMYEFLHRLQIKGWCRRKVGLIENGSWAPSAGRVMKEMLGQMKDIELVEPVVTIRSRMKREDLPALNALADAILG